MIRSLVRSLVGRMTVVMSPRGHVRLLCSSGVLSQHIMHWMIYVVKALGLVAIVRNSLLRPSYSAYSLHGTPGQDPVSGPGVHCRVVAARRLKKASVRRALRAPRLKKARDARGAQALKKRSVRGAAVQAEVLQAAASPVVRQESAEEAQTPEGGERALEERRR